MTTDPIRNKDDIERLAGYWLDRGNIRNYVLILLGVYSALRISDELILTWGDVYDFERRQFKSHISLTEKKTGKTRAIIINKFIKNILNKYLASLGQIEADDYLFCRENINKPISRVRVWAIIKKAAAEMNIEGNISCHSLRKTFGYHAWQKNVSPAVIMKIYNHSSFNITSRYLGIEQDELDQAQQHVFAGLVVGRQKGKMAQNG